MDIFQSAFDGQYWSGLGCCVIALWASVSDSTRPGCPGEKKDSTDRMFDHLQYCTVGCPEKCHKMVVFFQFIYYV